MPRYLYPGRNLLSFDTWSRTTRSGSEILHSFLNCSAQTTPPGLQLNTIRFAIIDVLKHPRPGFEQVVTSHFRVLRPRILATVNRWVIESVPLGEAAQGRLRRAAAELRQLLSAL
jgi:hypothetical protein